VSGRDSQARQGCGVDSSLTWAPANVSALNAPFGEQVRRRPADEALERGGTSPEGVTAPRERRNLTRGGALPPSEAKVCSCSVAPLEWSGVLLEGGWAAGATRAVGPAVGQ
jgi:hypothetical protein